MKIKHIAIYIACAFILISCDATTTFTGPSGNIGPVTISAYLNSDNEIVLGGTYSQTLVGDSNLGLN